MSNPWSLFVTINGDVYIDNGIFHDWLYKWAINATSSELVRKVNGTCTGLFIDINNGIYCSSVNHHRVIKVELNSDIMISMVVAGRTCPGLAPNMLNHPHGIFVDLKLNLYVADTNNDRIQRFARGQLDAITVVGLEAQVRSVLRRPTGIVLDANDYMYVVDSHNHRIIRSTVRAFECLVGCSGESGSTSSQLHNPQTMAFDSDGNILVTDFNNHRIQKFILVENSFNGSQHKPCEYLAEGRAGAVL
jgi:hypothetical protein